MRGKNVLHCEAWQGSDEGVEVSGEGKKKRATLKVTSPLCGLAEEM